ncbi:MAG TPA: YIP1 family protein [Terriglobia bacterium]|nr:YIP1 family protein [Terriglobia bacterium]
MSTAVAMPPVEEPPAKSFLQRFIGVFVSPVETFADIVRKPDWIAPLAVLVVASVATVETMLAKIGAAAIVRSSIAQSKQGAQMSADQIQQAVDRGAGITAIIMHVTGFLAVPIVLLIIAGIGMLIVSGVFGGSVKFKTAFSVTAYADLVAVLGALMAIALILFGDPERFNPQNPVPGNLGFFLDPQTTSKPLMALANSLDVFTFWFMALLGIGFAKAGSSEADRRTLKPMSVFLTFFGLWVILVLIKMGWAMVTG